MTGTWLPPVYLWYWWYLVPGSYLVPGTYEISCMPVQGYRYLVPPATSNPPWYQVPGIYRYFAPAMSFVKVFEIYWSYRYVMSFVPCRQLWFGFWFLKTLEHFSWISKGSNHMQLKSPTHMYHVCVLFKLPRDYKGWKTKYDITTDTGFEKSGSKKLYCRVNIVRTYQVPKNDRSCNVGSRDDGATPSLHTW